jgi:hypothetical protein
VSSAAWSCPPQRHFAVTAAVVCAQRPVTQLVVAITDHPDSSALAWGRSRGVMPTVVVWGDRGDIRTPDDVGPAISRGGTIHLPVDLSRTDDLVAVAGPIIAWT